MAVTEDELSAFYRRTVNELFRYASRLTGNDRAATEELVQETYLQLVRRVRGGATLDVDIGWLTVACRHRYIDRLRSDQRRKRREFRVGSEPPPTPHAGGRTADAVADLPAPQRTAMVMRYVDDLPVADIAREMGRSVHAVESLLARGREAVRIALTKPSTLATLNPPTPFRPTINHEEQK